MAKQKDRYKKADATVDSLRGVALSQDTDLIESYEAALAAEVDDGKLFGLNAVERMFLSMGLFGVTLVVSILLLLVTESIGL